ncbi:MAG: PPOX class F420-dependent oxidoreductase [Candidatus Micrarchaeota archaeon]|nr:PPOX class F420-dependent oxidoreductase [Candidatus Micrarchaeota archaeon]
MLDKKAIAMIEEKNFAFLATVSKDGSPQLTPTWVDTDGKRLLINTAMGRAKQRNTARDSRVAVVVPDSKNMYSYLYVKGRVVEQRKEGATEHIDKLAKKYLGKEEYPWKDPKETRVMLVIEPEKVISQ